MGSGALWRPFASLSYVKVFSARGHRPKKYRSLPCVLFLYSIAPRGQPLMQAVQRAQFVPHCGLPFCTVMFLTGQSSAHLPQPSHPSVTVKPFAPLKGAGDLVLPQRKKFDERFLRFDEIHAAPPLIASSAVCAGSGNRCLPIPPQRRPRPPPE